MSNWFGKWVVKQVMGDGSKEFIGGLRIFCADPAWTEAKFRNELQSHLGRLGADELKREAGITGTGTRIDLYAHEGDHDYLITIKKGLSQQKIKKVIGEIQIMMANWRARVPGNKTHIIFCFFGCKDGSEIEHLGDFVRFAGPATNDDFEIHFAHPCESEEEFAAVAKELGLDKA